MYASGVQDWLDYSKGLKDFDTSDFYCFFTEHFTKEGLAEVFALCKNGDQLLERFINVYDSGLIYANPYADFKGIESSTAELLEIVRRCIRVKVNVLHKLAYKEKAESLSKKKIIFTEDHEKYDELWRQAPFDDTNEIIGDHFIDSRIPGEKKIYALKEAFYGIQCNFELTWYLLKPVVDSPYNTDVYFELYKRKSAYMILEDEVWLRRV